MGRRGVRVHRQLRTLTHVPASDPYHARIHQHKSRGYSADMNHSLMIEQPKASRKRGDATDRWIGLRRRARTPRLRFITFPYAGSGASAYRRWLTDLAHEDWLDFVVVQLPGREKRISEPPYTEIGPLLGELEWVLSALVDLPYVLFGYSMGALLAYELALRL